MDVAIVTAIIGLVTGAVATAYKSRKDLEVQYDIKLREERIAAYKELWKQLARLAYYSPPQTVTYGVARELATALRTWYFDVGGLLMSEGTREPYFDLQRALKTIGDSDGANQDALKEDTRDALKQLASRLRTSTTDDVATRVGSLLGPTRWFERGAARVTVTRGWRFDTEATGVWRIRVVNRSSTKPLRLSGATIAGRNAEPLGRKKALPQMLFPREDWQGYVPDEPRLMAGERDPFRAGRAEGPRWSARSRAAGDPPASPIPGDAHADQPRVP